MGVNAIPLRSPYFLSRSALLTAIGVLLPAFFHQLGIAGKVFLPMHFPVLIAGLLLGPWGGLVVGLLSPSLSSLMTGMPPFPNVLAMIPELITYGILSGWLYHRLETNLWVALLGAMAAGRAVLGLAIWALVHLLGLHLTPLVFMAYAVLTGIPGIAGQVVLIPIIMRKLEPFGRKSHANPRNR